MNLEEMELILVTDVGSTTTKARLFKKVKGEYRFICSGEAPTTVEAPFEDVTMGVCNAVREVEELTGLKILASASEGIIVRDNKSPGAEGVDLYATTSSAGGGLQMMVYGITKSITGESAERAALGAGAIVIDVITLDDGKPLFEKIEKTRFTRPDIVLISGGTDGGAVKEVVTLAEILRMANPRARFGADFRLPVIYAGNKDAREHIEKVLSDRFALQIVDNIRPEIGVENVEPCRQAIHQQFLEHVMSHAPGYDKLMKWTKVPIMPTPMAEGKMFQLLAKQYNANIIGVGLGGATTNVYSVFYGRFVRTVSANLGMSYSICNVFKEAGAQNILRWIPFEIDEDELMNRLYNKMIRPTTLPQTIEDLVIEHAVAREAIRLGFNHHKLLARGLRGVKPSELTDIIARKVEGLETYIDMLRVDIIGGTGGLLSRAPRRAQSMMILIDSFQPEGITKIIQDSVFMMPHLGVLSTVHPKAAIEIFEKDCVVHLGTCIAPRGVPEDKNAIVLRVKMYMSDESVVREEVSFGEIKLIPLPSEQTITMEITPHKECDMGAGSGKTIKAKVSGGVVGVVFDARGRPLQIPEDRKANRDALIKWFKALKAYPEDALERMSKG
ncbi:MAG: glutamate mutase L [Candidatus Bathyarchaeia archaeon]